MNFNENLLLKNRVKCGGRGKKSLNNVICVQRGIINDKSNSSKSGSVLSSSNTVLKHNKRNNDTPIQTASTSTRSSIENDSKTIVAITEGRGQASWEIGLAAFDISRPSIILCQFADTQSYVNTLTKINILNATEILIPNTFITSTTNNRLLEKLKEQFKNVNIYAVSRSTFNKCSGLQYIQNLCLTEFNSVLLILQHRYYALTAASALINYLENVLNKNYARDSLKVEYQESEGYTIIDISTADNLELVASTFATRNNKRYGSLFGVLNHCVTKIGTRTLRSSILQPPSTLNEIEARLDCVEEFINNPYLLTTIREILLKVPNIEQILSLSSVIARTNDNNAESQLNYVLLLNSLLELIKPFHDLLENNTQLLFVELRNLLSSESFINISALLRTIIHDDAHPGKGAHGISQRCFAVKHGVNGLLDMVRKLYSERIENLREYVKELGEKHNLPLVLHNTNKKGYHITFLLNSHQKRTFKKSDLPPEFIYVERLPNSFILKTEELLNKSIRIDDILTEILKISNKIIQSTLLHIKQYLPLFHKLCEYVAKLDMLQSLAQASKNGSYTRPKFNNNFMEIKLSRHPLLEYLCSDPPVPNDVFASEEKNFTIITGPNGSGKSIYIRQILLLQVMAQVGCYVPAESAIFRISDRILARVYLEDNLDYGASTFVLELKEIQCFLKIMTKKSLFVIDELCRSTAEGEGTALAAAIAEKLCRTPTFTFFTTHYKFLTKLADMYYNVANLHLDAKEAQSRKGTVLEYNYNVVPGPSNLERYGICLAKLCWPESVIQIAENVFQNLCQFKKWTTSIAPVEKAKRLKYELISKLHILKLKGILTRNVINDCLRCYQNDLRNVECNINLQLLSESSGPPSDNDGINNNVHQNQQIIALENSIQSDCRYYIHPQVEYSADDQDMTIQFPEDQNEYNLNIPSNNYFEQGNYNFTNYNDSQDNNGPLYEIRDLENDINQVFNEENRIALNDSNSYAFSSFGNVSMNSDVFSLHQGTYRNRSFIITNNMGSNSNKDVQSNERDESTNNIQFDKFLMDNNRNTSTPINFTNNKFQQYEISARKDDNLFNDTNITDVLENLPTDIRNQNNGSNKHIQNQSNSLTESKELSSNSTKLISSNEKTSPILKEKNVCIQQIPQSSNNYQDSLKSNPKRKKKKPVIFKTPVKKCDWTKYGISDYKIQTERQIRKEFEEQSNKLIESGDMSKYMEYIQNRPTINQMKEVTTVAMIHKTNDGVVVVPAVPKTRKRKLEETSFMRTVSFNEFDLSILSDEKSKNFEEFLKNKNNIPIFDVCNPNFQRINRESARKENTITNNFRFDIIQENVSENDPLRKHPYFNEEYDNNGMPPACSIATKSKIVSSSDDNNPDYIESDNANNDKSFIDKLMEKYLNDSDSM